MPVADAVLNRTVALVAPRSNDPSATCDAVRGLLAGVAGTLVLTGFERLEWALLGGRPAAYAPARIGRRLAARWMTGNLRSGTGGELGYALRWVYGPGLGLLFAMLRPLLPRNTVAAGVCLGALIFLFELVAMPAVDATPPPRAWAKRETAMLWLHTGVFGVATAIALKGLARVLRC